MLQSIQAGSLSAAAGSATRPAEAAAKPISDAAPAAASEQLERSFDEAELSNAVADLNKMARTASQGVRFSVDEDTGRTVVKVVDTQTDTVLRQIPTVEALKLWRSIEKMQGVMLRDSA